MATTFFGIAVDCNDAAALARFWGAVLDRQVAEGPTAQHAILLVSDDPAAGPPVTFQRVPEAKTVKNRLHLDLITDTFDAETERLLSLGAHRLRDVQGVGSSWTTFADIEGNELTSSPDRTAFPAGTPRVAMRGIRPMTEPRPRSSHGAMMSSQVEVDRSNSAATS
jgi:hypothetical protein